MSNLATRPDVDMEAIAPAILQGDMSKLSAEQKVSYYHAVCAATGLNPATKPFHYIKMKGSEVLYPTKRCAEDLRKIHVISLGGPQIAFTDEEVMATISATKANGQQDTDVGIVPIKGLKGEDRANAILKAITKAKRRVTFSMCGLSGLVDKSGAIVVDMGTVQDASGNVLAPVAECLTDEDFEIMSLAAQEAGWTEEARRDWLSGKAGGRSPRDLGRDQLEELLTELQDPKIRDRYLNLGAIPAHLQ